jgi:hypothetical protein
MEINPSLAIRIREALKLITGSDDPVEWVKFLGRKGVNQEVRDLVVWLQAYYIHGFPMIKEEELKRTWEKVFSCSFPNFPRGAKTPSP